MSQVTKKGLSSYIRTGTRKIKILNGLKQIIMEMTGGGADYCFECVGMTSLVHEAYASCRKVCSMSICI